MSKRERRRNICIFEKEGAFRLVTPVNCANIYMRFMTGSFAFIFFFRKRYQITAASIVILSVSIIRKYVMPLINFLSKDVISLIVSPFRSCIYIWAYLGYLSTDFDSLLETPLHDKSKRHGTFKISYNTWDNRFIIQPPSTCNSVCTFKILITSNDYIKSYNYSAVIWR